MKICVDFFRPTGKWYSGGEVEIPDGTHLSDPDFKKIVRINQKILCSGWEDQFHVVTRDTPENSANPEYKGFFYHFFAVGTFNQKIN